MSTPLHMETEVTQQQFSDSQKRHAVVITVALFPIVFSIFIFGLIVLIGNIQFPDKIGTKSEWGEIVLPVDKSTISKKFSISGVIEDQPEGSFIYLMESRSKFFWPKMLIGSEAKTWKKSLTARGRREVFFEYLLIQVDNNGKKQLEDWFKTSRKTGKYPGFKKIDFAKVVAKVRVKTK